MNKIKKFFNYIQPLWLGDDNKISLKSTLAIAFSIDFISNLSHAIYKWEDGRSMESLSLVLGIEAGLIVALLGLTAYSNLGFQKIEADRTKDMIKVDTVNTENVETVNSKNTNVNIKPDNPDA